MSTFHQIRSLTYTERTVVRWACLYQMELLLAPVLMHLFPYSSHSGVFLVGGIWCWKEYVVHNVVNYLRYISTTIITVFAYAIHSVFFPVFPVVIVHNPTLVRTALITVKLDLLCEQLTVCITAAATVTRWARLHGHEYMGTTTWARLHGHDYMGTTTWALLHGHDYMGTTTWARLHGHDYMGTTT